MAHKAITLNYRSVDRFVKDYKQLQSGRLFLPVKRPLPVGTGLELRLRLPQIASPIPLNTIVRNHISRKQAAALQVPGGMVVELVEKPQAALSTLNRRLAAHRHYEGLSALEIQAPADPPAADAETGDPPQAGSALPMTWIRQALSQEQKIPDDSAEPDPAPPAVSQKKELTPEERILVKPSGEFIMDLTKAMLRTGYYSPDHPGSQEAKRGLYEAFLKCLGASQEIMITNQETRESTDILITGILDDPVSVRTLVGAGMAELFVPKLQEYFNRKNLISFAVKKRITRDHFEGFIDIMSDPRVDQGEGSRVGDLLSQALAADNITEISTVFVDDIIVLERNLPWRVEMAIQRLAKDLKVLPMFEGESDEAIRRMKLQIIQDIIRPLRHPEFLKDLIINCYVIAKHVRNIAVEDIEKIIIEGFPMETLLPTSRFIFEELNRLRKISAADPNNPSVKNRFAGVKRILKHVARRLVLSDVRGANRFIEELYLNRVLKFEELSPDVQYMVNTHRMASDVRHHVKSYGQRLLQCRSGEDALVLFKCFRRVIPALIGQGDWHTVAFITRAVSRVSGEKKAFFETSDPPADPLRFIYHERENDIIEAFEQPGTDHRKDLEKTLIMLGSRGIEILCRILTESESRKARKSAMNALTKSGDLARAWVVKILDDPQQEWFLKRNALMLLGRISDRTEDVLRARKHLNHPHPRVRDEALSVVVKCRPEGVERFIVDALGDSDRKVQWRAMNALCEIKTFSDGTFAHLAGIISADLPDEEGAGVEQYQFLTRLVGAFGAMAPSAQPARMEAAILDLTNRIAAHKKGILRRFKKVKNPAESTLLSTAVHTLGQIGGQASEEFLTKMAGGKSALAQAALKAAETIRQRNGAASSV